MTSYSTIKSTIQSRYLEIKGCGANKEGGGGFVAGNTCSKGGSSGTGSLSEDEKKTAIAKLDSLPRFEEEYFKNQNNVYAGDVFKANDPVSMAMGVSNAEKKKFGKESTVELASLTAGQAHIPREGLRSYIKEMPKNSARIPEVVKLKNDPKQRTVIISGHTRLGAQVLAGRSKAKVIQYTLDRSTGDLVKNE